MKEKQKTEKVDYRKLLKICMQTWMESEGVCGFLIDDLSDADKEAIKQIYKEFEEEGIIHKDPKEN